MNERTFMDMNAMGMSRGDNVDNVETRVKKESNLTINFANLLQKPTVTITLLCRYINLSLIYSTFLKCLVAS